MQTYEESFWVKYLIMEDNKEEKHSFFRKIADDAPEEAKKAYKKYCDEMQKYIDRGEPIPK